MIKKGPWTYDPSQDRIALNGVSGDLNAVQHFTLKALIEAFPHMVDEAKLYNDALEKVRPGMTHLAFDGYLQKSKGAFKGAGQERVVFKSAAFSAWGLEVKERDLSQEQKDQIGIERRGSVCIHRLHKRVFIEAVRDPDNPEEVVESSALKLKGKNFDVFAEGFDTGFVARTKGRSARMNTLVNGLDKSSMCKGMGRAFFNAVNDGWKFRPHYVVQAADGERSLVPVGAE